AADPGRRLPHRPRAAVPRSQAGPRVVRVRSPRLAAVERPAQGRAEGGRGQAGPGRGCHRRPAARRWGDRPMMREDLEKLIAQAQSEDLPRLAGDFEAARAAAWRRMLAPRLPAADAAPDQNLSVDEAAGRLGVSKDYLYRPAER